MFRYLESEALTPYLYELIGASAQPLKSVETDFAVDSSGFSTGQFMRWFDVKYGKKEDRRMWLKVHLMCALHDAAQDAVNEFSNRLPDRVEFGWTEHRMFGVRGKAYPARRLSVEITSLEIERPTASSSNEIQRHYLSTFMAQSSFALMIMAILYFSSTARGPK